MSLRCHSSIEPGSDDMVLENVQIGFANLSPPGLWESL